eukprot:TRINITY_DN74237_c0_g1_i1.p1 TRINITY_DN74237_c0_g1~~TRINITY_DN74237_c0_g1_i1.p1  ORF type:complete len:547 (-),score=89.91 TRINITY_DN74237_c0_g1_i1:58-1698(-)
MKNALQNLSLLMLACLVWPGNCRRLKDKAGLRGGGQASPRGKPSKDILEELEEELGREHRTATEEQLHEFEDELRVTFKALPKNSRGAVEAPSARYALHRLFVQRYGWEIKGLKSESGVWDSDSPIQSMGDRVPEKMRELFDHRLGNYGLSLHELAVVAVSIDQMIHTDVPTRLKIVYGAYLLQQDDVLDWKQAYNVMRAYMSNFLLGSYTEHLSHIEVKLNAKSFERRYTRAEGAENLLIEVVTQAAPDYNLRNFSFDQIASVMTSFGKHLGSFEDKECQVMKDALVKLEHHPGSGRVRLGDFYDKSEMFHFRENADYLRNAGVLDESNPKDPKVIIPNYLASPSNCVNPAGFYEICCFDQCEELMDKIEAKLEAPMATPEAIASTVTSMRSDSRASSMTLPTGLMDLLQKVAAHHAGMVPIHGRLFMQWMHQAFPRECSHPSATPRSPNIDFADVTDEEKLRYVDIVRQMELDQGNESDAEHHIPSSIWTMDEQLVDEKAYKSHTKARGMQDLMAFAVVGLTCVAMTKLLFGYGDRRLKRGKEL